MPNIIEVIADIFDRAIASFIHNQRDFSYRRVCIKYQYWVYLFYTNYEDDWSFYS